jgi:nucleotide-binding universal stress UspA family protein
MEWLVRKGAIADEIASFAKERGVSCIVMNVHRGNLDDETRLHGIVSDVIREAHCPVLTIP